MPYLKRTILPLKEVILYLGKQMHFFWKFGDVAVNSRRFLNGRFHSQIFLAPQFSATISELIIFFLLTKGKLC